MEQYWKVCPTAPPILPTENPNNLAKPIQESLLSEFDCHRIALIANQDKDEGWRSEMRRYLRDLPVDVMKDTDIVKWWQVCVAQSIVH